MRRRNKFFLAAFILAGASVTLSLSLGNYLMSQFPILANVADNNPFEALRIAGKMVVNELTQTPVKTFDLENADHKYNQTVVFPEDRLDLTTAEQIVEWSASYNDQPWVDDVDRFLAEANYSLIDTAAHFVFVMCESGNNPVMTLTYFSANHSLLVEKGWLNRVPHNSYTLIVTEKIALDVLELDSNYPLIVKAIIENLNGTIKVQKE